ncbi:hypothetical protein [Hymenobacter coccineus]|uniref:Lipoprotein n=1 Tax=Hymenobacter coccineus TaxID=1908235 RepID=A0A1G1TM87_9BACT|nr:hypothetical protein [Hymenobacter coccineus]OGX91986.1 hypothetical protein BEN49_17810 [Hymenobacter coccineus]
MKALLLLPLALLLGCKKDAPAPADQLPPATQTGANAFGCLLNGQPWTPQGYNSRPNFIVTYDPGYRGGNLQVRVYRYPDGAAHEQYLIFGGNRIAQPGSYPLVLSGDREAFFADLAREAPCKEFLEAPSLTYRTGTLTVTRLDLARGVIAGTFAFTLYRPGCDTIKVTQGRFDKKL